jgi:uncharacterized repeat protein (TIGR01451 family)
MMARAMLRKSSACWTATTMAASIHSLPLVKSSNVSSATVGKTITFCIAWTNNSSGALTRTFYDQLAAQLTYAGGESGCSAAGQLVTCSFATSAGASGNKCFWAVVNAAPP